MQINRIGPERSRSRCRYPNHDTADETSRQRWLEIARRYEQLAEVPGKTPGHVERVERKK